jgi:exopolysaccharide biosynthesis protein
MPLLQYSEDPLLTCFLTDAQIKQIAEIKNKKYTDTETEHRGPRRDRKKRSDIGTKRRKKDES